MTYWKVFEMCVLGHGSKMYESPCLSNAGGSRQSFEQRKGEEESRSTFRKLTWGRGLGVQLDQGSSEEKEGVDTVPFHAKGPGEGQKLGRKEMRS